MQLVPYIHWIIVEDADATSILVESLLIRHGLADRSTLLAAKTPADFKLTRHDPSWAKPRGVEQRNKALAWVRSNVKYSPTARSVIYFMDDDNTYSFLLFEEMKKIEAGKVAVWPVGLVGGLLVEKPVLDKDDNHVMGFNSVVSMLFGNHFILSTRQLSNFIKFFVVRVFFLQWRPERPFPIDMAGFAISSDLILNNSEAMFSYEVERGYQESEILRSLAVSRDLQPLANLCTQIYVWHTRTEAPKLEDERKLRKEGPPSDTGMEV